MDTNLIVGKVVDGKEVTSANFDELSQFTTAYFADGTFRVFTAQEAVEAFSDGETFIHVVTHEEAANIMAENAGGEDFQIQGGDLISAPITEGPVPEEVETVFAFAPATEVIEVATIEDDTATEVEITTSEGTEPVEVTESNVTTND